MREADLLTADELAGRLQVRPSTIRQWARRGLIPTVRISPKVVRYDLASVVVAVTKRQCAKGVSHAK
jgi:DNA-binding transcriptional MerR regulator